MGITRRRNGSWQASIQVDGVRHRRTFATQQRAREWLTKVAHEASEAKHAGVMGRLPRRTFDDAFLVWLRDYVPHLRSHKRTLEHARQVRDHFPSGISIEEAPAAANRMRAAMLGRGLKPATVNQRLAVVRRVLYLAEEWGWTRESLGRRVKLLPPNNERHIYLSREQIHALADAAGDGRDVVLLLAYTGLRLGELYGLTAGHVRDGTIFLDARTKSGRPRAIPIPKPAADCAIPPTISRRQFRYRWERAREVTGLVDLHVHDLRHTAAYMMLQAGASLALVRDWLGHSNVSVTSRYLHLTRDDLAAVAANMK